MKLYREVKCSDRLPEESADYLTNKSEATFDAEEKVWVQHGFGGWQIARISWWLEPIEITDGDIDDLVEKYAENLSSEEPPNTVWHAKNDFRKGATAIIKLLTNPS